MRIHLVALSLILAAAVACGSCTQEASRSGKLLTMAAEEAGLIDSLQDRLTRQLNIADLQIQTGQKTEAIKTLNLAAATLQTEEKDKKTLDSFRRIAGWTSVAQLSHRAGNDGFAGTAYVEAVEALHSVEPEAQRAEYVLSLSEVAFELKGKKEAGQLLVDGGTWAVKITDRGLRRYALTTFASQLVAYDDLEEARGVLRNEMDDPAWRADTLAAIARMNMNGKGVEFGVALAAAKSTPDSPAAQEASRPTSTGYSRFNKNVQYESNFRQQALQNGLAPNAGEPSP